MKNLIIFLLSIKKSKINNIKYAIQPFLILLTTFVAAVIYCTVRFHLANHAIVSGPLVKVYIYIYIYVWEKRDRIIAPNS
jgi:hypothetical protein